MIFFYNDFGGSFVEMGDTLQTKVLNFAEWIDRVEKYSFIRSDWSYVGF